MGGKLFVGDRVVAKAGDMLAEDAELTLKGKDHPWVSRGGIKLDHGLTHFGFDVTGAVAIDVGSSTGGFTDVLLSRGAARVYAIDVGTNQLAWKLRQDERVVVMEQFNARDYTASTVCEPVDIIVCDASFISLSKVLDAVLDDGHKGSKLLALVKPQFEAGRGEVGKGGVVRGPDVHARVCADAARWVESKGWRVIGIEKSPITGPEGNVEVLLGGQKE